MSNYHAEIINEVEFVEVIEDSEDDQGEAEPLVTANEAMRAAKILEVYFVQNRIPNNGNCFSKIRDSIMKQKAKTLETSFDSFFVQKVLN